MIDSLYIGATGMHAQQMNVDVVANNLANVNTTAFKRNRIDFEDLLYRTTRASNAGSLSSARQPQTGMGAAVSASGKVFTLGDMKKTDQPLDVAIQGQGFFEITLSDGNNAYTRDGAFKVNADGLLVSQSGHALSANIQIPPDTTAVKIETDGRVYVTVPGETRPLEVGQIELFSFVNPAGLNPIGNNLYGVTADSGDVIRGTPGQTGNGTLAQGFLEGSNVKLVDEMINLILAQRAYELNSKVVQASDEMLSISNGLFR